MPPVHPPYVCMPYIFVHFCIHLYIPCTSVCPIHLYTPCMSPCICMPPVHPPYVCMPYSSVHFCIHLYTPHKYVHPLYIYTPPYICTLPICAPYICMPQYTAICLYALYICALPHTYVHPHTFIHIWDIIVFCSRGCSQYQIFVFITVTRQIADFMYARICTGLWIFAYQQSNT